MNRLSGQFPIVIEKVGEVVEEVEEPVIESPVEAVSDKVIEKVDEVVEEVEEPVVESRPVGLSRSSKKSRPFEAVPEKSSKELKRLLTKLARLSKKSKNP